LSIKQHITPIVRSKVGIFQHICTFSGLQFQKKFQDDDTSYLDEATRAPDAPHREPGADSVATDKDGVLVDEFGLPKIPAQ